MTQKRWKLSITELGSTKVVAETVVEADNWMTALSRARTQIGEKSGVPQGSSVAVAPDGMVTILDAVGRRQYALAHTIESLPPAPAARPPSSPPPAPVGRKADLKRTMAYLPSAGLPSLEAKTVSAVPASAPPAAVAAPAVAPAAVAAPAVAAPAVAAPAVAAPAVVAASAAVAAPADGKKKKVSRATIAYMPSPLQSNGHAQDASPKPVSVPPPSASAPPAQPISVRPASVPSPAALASQLPPASPSAAPAAASPRSAAPAAASLPAATAAPDPYELLFARDSEPNAQSPLVYRERNWLVPSDMVPDDAELLLRTRFSALRDELASRPKGKLVKLAVFDHRWEGQPQRAPLLVLTWKDWRGEPEVLAPSATGSMPPASASLPPASLPPASLPPASMPPASMPPASMPPASVAPTAVAPASVAPTPSSPPAPYDASRPSTPPVGVAPPSIMVDPELLDAPTIKDLPVSQPAGTPRPGPSVAPAAAGPSVVAPPVVESSASSSSGRQRTKTDDRLASAFEGLQDLFFLPTPADGAEFLLRLLGELVPAEASSVALYDINTDELRFVAAVGAGADERKGDAVPSQVGILGSALRSVDVCLIVPDVPTDGRFDPGIDGRVGLEATNLAVMPVSAHGRLLGAVQLVNRIGDLEFSRADANLLVYIGQRFGEFLHQHKVAAAPRRSQPAR